jgi:hypothetical protein
MVRRFARGRGDCVLCISSSLFRTPATIVITTPSFAPIFSLRSLPLSIAVTIDQPCYRLERPVHPSMTQVVTVSLQSPLNLPFFIFPSLLTVLSRPDYQWHFPLD